MAGQESPSSAAFGGIRYARVDLERLVVLHIHAVKSANESKAKGEDNREKNGEDVCSRDNVSEEERMSVCVIM